MNIELKIKDFIPVPRKLILKVGGLRALVYGQVFAYSQMGKKVCCASQGRIATELKLTRPSVNKMLGELCDLGYIEDTTPDNIGPHSYIVKLSPIMIMSMEFGEQKDDGEEKVIDDKENISSNKKKQKTYIYPSMILDMFPEVQRILGMAFIRYAGSGTGAYAMTKKDEGLWRQELGKWVSTGATQEDIEDVIRTMRAKDLYIKGPQSITGMLKNAISIKEKPRTSKVNVEELEIE